MESLSVGGERKNRTEWSRRGTKNEVLSQDPSCIDCCALVRNGIFGDDLNGSLAAKDEARLGGRDTIGCDAVIFRPQERFGEHVSTTCASKMA